MSKYKTRKITQFEVQTATTHTRQAVVCLCYFSPRIGANSSASTAHIQRLRRETSPSLAISSSAA